MRFSCKLLGHKWNGCICKRCGKQRDEQHDWNGCKCNRCMRMRNEQHDYSTCRCSRCLKIIEVSEINELKNQTQLFNIAKTAPEIGHSSVQNVEKAKEIASAAIDKITDDHLLANIAKNTYIEITIKAMKKIADQTILIDIMEEESFHSYNFRQVKDLFPDVFAHIAKNKNNKQNKRVSAFTCIEDKSIFTTDELKELEELESLERENWWNNSSVNNLPTQGWEYS